MIMILTSGCITKKEIQLESLSIIDIKKIEEGYKRKKYIKYNDRGECILKFKERRNQLLTTSNKFLRINFTSSEAINLFQDRRAGLYVNLKADKKRLEALNFCPLVEVSPKGYHYSYFYPTQYKIKNEYFQPKEYNDYETFDLKTIKELKFQIMTVGYSRWKTNEILITKDMIDRLKYK